MIQITVSDEQAQQIAGASAPIVVVDSQGRTLGQITPIAEIDCPRGMTAERWAEIKRRLREPGKYVPYQTIKEKLGQ